MPRSRSPWLVISAAAANHKSSADYRGRLRDMMQEASSVVPEDHILVIVRDADRPWWMPVLGQLPEANLLNEPLDRGSAPGVLLALLRVLRRDPAAELMIVACDALPGAIRAARESDAAPPRPTLPPVWWDSPTTLLWMFHNTQPLLLSSLLRHVREEPLDAPASLDDLYAYLPAVDLDRDVFSKAQSAPSEAPAWAV